MKTEEITYLDGEFTVQEEVPATAAELIPIIGETAMVDEAVSNLYYRNRYPRVYKAVSAAVSALGFDRAVIKETTGKDGTVKKTHESPMDHLRAFLFGRKDKDSDTITTPAPEGSRDKLGALFLDIGPKAPLFVQGERVGGGGKISAANMANAQGIFDEGPESVDGAITTIESMVPGYKIARDPDGDATVESLARGIAALDKHLKNAAPKASDVLKKG